MSDLISVHLKQTKARTDDCSRCRKRLDEFVPVADAAEVRTEHILGCFPPCGTKHHKANHVFV
eukprot:9503329-Pyramimonas_sp.AAC.3